MTREIYCVDNSGIEHRLIKGGMYTLRSDYNKFHPNNMFMKSRFIEIESVDISELTKLLLN